MRKSQLEREALKSARMATVSQSNKFCPHCEKHVSKTTFFSHKRLYFDIISRKWSKSRVNFGESNFTAESSDEEMYDLEQDLQLYSPECSSCDQT